MKIKNEQYDEICVMMFSMQTLHYKGISIHETLNGVLKNLLTWYEESQDWKYAELAEMYLQAYVNMGKALDARDEQISKVLQILGKEADKFRPKGCFGGKRIRLNRSQVRSIIGKWKSTKKNAMTIAQVVDDIMEKVSTQQVGHYIYQYHRFADSENGIPDVYELVVEEEGSYFYDVNNFKFYTFISE